MPGAEGWRTADDWPPAEATLTAFALRADGGLEPEEGEPGFREYLYLPADSGAPANANPPELPSSLAWETAPLDADLEFAGNIELALEATITALDTSWIAVLYDVPPEGAAEPITAGWLRASLSAVDEAASIPGAPVLPIAGPRSLSRSGERVTYRIPARPERTPPSGRPRACGW